MKPKWIKFGEWFTTVGTDGDVELVEFRWFSLVDRQEHHYRQAEEPLMIQLYYRRLSPDQVVQLAWVRRDWTWRTPRLIKSEKLPTLTLG
jgi:hypothetical protein